MAASTRITGFLLVAAVSTIVSRMVPRSRIETCSRSNCCSTFCTSPSVISLGNQLIDQLRMRVRKPINQPLGFVARQQVMRIMLDQLGEMRREHRGMIDNRISSGDGLCLQIRA